MTTPAPDGGTNFWDLLVALSWPVGIILALLLFRKQLLVVLGEFGKKLQAASNLKVGSFELRGPSISPHAHTFADGKNYSLRNATQEDDQRRLEVYTRSRGLMLVHRIRPSSVPDQEYDISFFLERKTSKNFRTAEYIDVEFVEYYLGRYFGENPYGSWYVVRTAKDGFAVSTSAYGSPLCIARVHFRDKEVVELYRYLDFQMASAFSVDEKPE